MKKILEEDAPRLQVKTAIPGEAALELLLKKKDVFRLILLDLNSYERLYILHRIRADARLQDIPVQSLLIPQLNQKKKRLTTSGEQFYSEGH